MKTFTKWFIVNAAVLTLSFFAYAQGLFDVVFKNDISHLTTVITVLYVALSAFAGKIALEVDKLKFPLGRLDLERISKKLDICWFTSGHFLNLGLMGTIIGFCYSIGSSLDPTKDANNIILELKAGASTLMFTTLFGLLASVLLQLQTYLIQYNVTATDRKATK